jgi:uncharacterized protein YjeT (DUF2065 family)
MIVKDFITIAGFQIPEAGLRRVGIGMQSVGVLQNT